MNNEPSTTQAPPLPQLVETPEALAQLCTALADAETIALDTEFIREKTYYAKLGLIQLATEEVVACVDPLAIADLSPLREVLCDPGRLKIFHAARQDLEIFYQLWDALPCPVFDTQLAVTLLGLGEQLSYAAVVKHFLDHELPKTQARSDWARRPLDEAQLRYAADDVRYLLALYPRLRAQLQERNRLNWLDEEFEALCDPQQYQIDSEQAWRRIGAHRRLRGQALMVLQRLAAWREQTAQQQDRPRKWILSDDLLVMLAKHPPADVAQFMKLRGLPRGFNAETASRLLELIQKAKQQPRDQWPQAPAEKRLRPEQEATVDVAMGLIRQRAIDNELTPAILATRKDVERLVRGDPEVAVLHGWRRAVVGNDLRAFVDGQLQIRIDADSGRLQVISSDAPV
jgi:ribonuclease D